MKHAYTVFHYVSLHAIGEGSARNCYGAFATKADAERWLKDQTGELRNPEIRRVLVNESAPIVSWRQG